MSSDAADELAVTTCLNHLVSLLALPSICQGRSPADIVRLTLDALRPLVSYEVGFVRAAGGAVEELEAGEAYTSQSAELRDTLLELAESGSAGKGAWASLSSGTDLRVVSVPLGFHSNNGVLVLAARRAEFPTHSEVVQLRAAASLLASTLEGALARERLEAARAELEEANRAKDEFLAMLGHELRNPLAPIVTAMELLRRHHAPSRELEIIDRQVAHMRRLVDDLLDVSRIIRGRIDVAIEPLDLAEAIADALDVAQPLIEERHHHVTIDCPAGQYIVPVDRIRCSQIFANLLTNAAKYTEPGGRIWIEAKRESDDGDVVVRVRDSGIGITPETLPRVFTLFEQERRAIDRSQGGLGLGLAIVCSLVKLHGGDVWAESEGLGKGSTFSVRLPTIAGTAVLPPEVTSAAVRHDPQRARRVLVVDDNRDAAEMLALLLSEHGHEVRVAVDGFTAVEVAEQFVPELVLLDIGLPVIDGYQVAATLRKMPRFATTPIVALTGYGRPADRRRAEEVGFDRHFVKPIDPDALLGVVESLCGVESAS